MPRFKVTLTTVADLTVEVEAVDEESALDVAYKRGDEFAAQAHRGTDYVVALNDAWDLREPEVEDSDACTPMNHHNNAIWSVVLGQSPTARAVEPGIVGISIPDDVLAWAVTQGLADDAPDIYLLVAPADEAGEVLGELAYREFPMDADDLTTLRAFVGETSR
jgi:hypothetical protein